MRHSDGFELQLTGDGFIYQDQELRNDTVDYLVNVSAAVSQFAIRRQQDDDSDERAFVQLHFADQFRMFSANAVKVTVSVGVGPGRTVTRCKYFGIVKVRNGDSLNLSLPTENTSLPHAREVPTWSTEWSMFHEADEGSVAVFITRGYMDHTGQFTRLNSRSGLTYCVEFQVRSQGHNPIPQVPLRRKSPARSHSASEFTRAQRATNFPGPSATSADVHNSMQNLERAVPSQPAKPAFIAPTTPTVSDSRSPTATSQSPTDVAHEAHFTNRRYPTPSNRFDTLRGSNTASPQRSLSLWPIPTPASRSESRRNRPGDNGQVGSFQQNKRQKISIDEWKQEQLDSIPTHHFQHHQAPGNVDGLAPQVTQPTTTNPTLVPERSVSATTNSEQHVIELSSDDENSDDITFDNKIARTSGPIGNAPITTILKAEDQEEGDADTGSEDETPEEVQLRIEQYKIEARQLRAERKKTRLLRKKRTVPVKTEL